MYKKKGEQRTSSSSVGSQRAHWLDCGHGSVCNASHSGFQSLKCPGNYCRGQDRDSVVTVSLVAFSHASAVSPTLPPHTHHTHRSRESKNSGSASLRPHREESGQQGLLMPAQLDTQPMLLWKTLKNKVRKTYFQIQLS